MELRPSQLPLKMSTRNIPGGKGGRCVRQTTSPPSCAECHENLGAQTSWNPLGHTGAVTGLLYMYLPTRNISWGGKCGRCIGLTTLPLSCARMSENLGASTSRNPRSLSRYCFNLIPVKSPSVMSPSDYHSSYIESISEQLNYSYIT
jgi:hypothetical protein